MTPVNRAVSSHLGSQPSYVPQVEIGCLLAGRYRVTAKLGQGGMAQVVRATNVSIDSGLTQDHLDVALKLQLHNASEGGLDRRVVQELLVAARTRHPNLVGVFDFGIDPERNLAFFAMELLHGVDLATQLVNFPVADPRWFLPLFCEALDGLDCAHQAGIVHKDLKPANLFLDRKSTGQTKLRVTDFGIAHHAQRSRVTENGLIACTPQYCPPEYIASGNVTPASDVYQMGLVLAETLLGWPMVERGLPFVTAAYKHVNSQLALPSGWRGSPLGMVISRALAREPGERYSSAQEFRHALFQLDLEIAATTAQMHASLGKSTTQKRI